MAAALSRALKLPGKKSHDLVEYDPLRQADSDDSADDGDLNYQKNGSLQVEAMVEAVLSRDADTVVEMHALKGKHCRSDQPSSAEVHATEVSDEFAVKSRTPFLPCLRTAAFLLTLLSTMVLVLVCAFFIPCPKSRALKTSWNRSLGLAAGFPPAIALWDVNSDQLPDVIVSFSSTGKVRDQRGALRPQGGLKLHVSVAVLSGADGSVLWTTVASERLKFIHCGIGRTEEGEGTVCLLVGVTHTLKAVNSISGSCFWEMKNVSPSHRTPAAPPVQLPDVDGDGFADILLGSRSATLTNRIHDVSFVFVSGATGALIGQPVTYNVTGEGKLIGPKAYVSGEGALYVLFGYGSIQAVSVRDIYMQANGKGTLPPSLWKEDSPSEWKPGGSLPGVLDVYSNGSVQDVQAVGRPGEGPTELLLTTRNQLQLLRGTQLRQVWQAVGSSINGAPVAGFFNDDRVPDFLTQVASGNGTRKSLIIDGSSGQELWSAELDCRSQGSEAASVPLPDGRSAFLFWAGDCRAKPSALGGDTERDGQYRLYLLHPAYPGLLVELARSPGPVTASATGVWEQRKDAFHVAVTTDSSQATHRSRMGPLLVSTVGLKWAILHSRLLALDGADINIPSVRKFLSQLRFCTDLQL